MDPDDIAIVQKNTTVRKNREAKGLPVSFLYIIELLDFPRLWCVVRVEEVV